MSAKRGGEEERGEEEKTFFLRAPALGWLRMMLCFCMCVGGLRVCFAALVCAQGWLGMIWQAVCDQTFQSGLLAPGFLLAGAFFPFAWQHKLRGLSICLKVMDHSAGKFTLR